MLYALHVYDLYLISRDSFMLRVNGAINRSSIYPQRIIYLAAERCIFHLCVPRHSKCSALCNSLSIMSDENNNKNECQ